MTKALLPLIFLVVGSLAYSDIPDNGLAPAHQTPRLLLIAQADGKLFLAESEPKRNWSDALEYCQSMGLKLASITSNNQYEAIQNARNESTFFGSYWTAGRDAQAHRQISWHGTDEQPGNFLKLSDNFKPTFQTCLNYDTSTWIYLEKCSATLGTLCEAKVAGSGT